MLQCGEKQAERIEHWAKATGIWFDDIDISLSNILGEKIAEGGEAIVFDHGATLIKSIGLDYFIEPILALDRCSQFGNIFVIDCDIRINTPELKCGGTRILTTEIE